MRLHEFGAVFVVHVRVMGEHPDNGSAEPVPHGEPAVGVLDEFGLVEAVVPGAWSPTTVRGYATSLAHWWTFLEQRDEPDG